MWTGPDQGRPSAFPPPVPASRLSWRILHSWWLLLPIFGMGCLGGAGFLYVGLRASRPAWWISGIAYLLVGCSGFIAVGEVSPENPVSDIGLGAVFAVWFASMVHAAIINSSWLKWRAGYRPWYAGPQAPPPTWPPGSAPAPGSATPAPWSSTATPWPNPAAPAPWPGVVAPISPYSPLPPGLQVPAETYYGPGPSPYARPAQPAGLLDVNTATAEQLAGLAGFDLDRAHRTAVTRQVRGGFASLEEFALVAELPPHLFAPLRSRLTCVPLPRTAEGHQPQGRILDV